jgi:DNA cross-link repair 1C protein
VDKYKMRLYQALRGGLQEGAAFLTQEGPGLAGYTCGNTPQAGCLTIENNVRIHSCEKHTQCSAIDDGIVWIKPIVTRLKGGAEIAEIGIGGGAGDLTQRPELELDSDFILQRLSKL